MTRYERYDELDPQQVYEAVFRANWFKNNNVDSVTDRFAKLYLFADRPGFLLDGFLVQFRPFNEQLAVILRAESRKWGKRHWRAAEFCIRQSHLTRISCRFSELDYDQVF